MKLFRTVVFWCHLVVAVPAALVILVMSVSGVLLTYEKQIISWSDKRAYPVTVGANRLGVEELLAAVGKTEGRMPSNLLLHADGNAPAEARFGRQRTLFLDPHSGKVLGDGSSGVRPFFRAVTDWHRWLARSGDSRERGKSVTGASNLAFLFLVVSGIYLWWPRNWKRKALRNVTWFRRGLSGKARDFNWHNVMGIWLAVPLLIVVASGAVISYPWASGLVFRAFGEQAPARRESPATERRRGEQRPPISLAGLDKAWSVAEGRVPDWQRDGCPIGRA